MGEGGDYTVLDPETCSNRGGIVKNDAWSTNRWRVCISGTRRLLFSKRWGYSRIIEQFKIISRSSRDHRSNLVRWGWFGGDAVEFATRVREDCFSCSRGCERRMNGTSVIEQFVLAWLWDSFIIMLLCNACPRFSYVTTVPCTKPRAPQSNIAEYFRPFQLSSVSKNCKEKIVSPRIIRTLVGLIPAASWIQEANFLSNGGLVMQNCTKR